MFELEEPSLCDRVVKRRDVESSCEPVELRLRYFEFLGGRPRSFAPPLHDQSGPVGNELQLPCEVVDHVAVV